MTRWIFRMSRSARREKVQPGRPVWIGIRCGIAIGIAGLDSGDRPPEYVTILAVPTCDPRVGHGYIQHRKEMCVLGEPQRMAGGNLRGDPVPVERSVPGPEKREFRLVCRARGPIVGTHDLQLVVVGRILGTGESIRRRQPELRRPLEHPWRHSRELRSRAGRVQRWCWTPDADGRRSSYNSEDAQERRRSWREPIVEPPGPNAVGYGLSPIHSRLNRAGSFDSGDRRNRGVAPRGERYRLRRIDPDEHRVGGLNRGGALRGVAWCCRADMQRCVAGPDAIHGIEDGCRY